MAMYSAHIVFDYHTVYLNPWVSSASDEDELEEEAIQNFLEQYPFELTAEQEQMIINSIQSIETELQTD
jgi:RecG-like helicase